MVLSDNVDKSCVGKLLDETFTGGGVNAGFGACVATMLTPLDHGMGGIGGTVVAADREIGFVDFDPSAGFQGIVGSFEEGGPVFNPTDDEA